MKPLALCVAAAFAFPSHAGGTLPANALPEGGKVIAGQASITQGGNRMDIAQGSQRAILDWTRFNIGSQASVNFAQPNAGAVALNRVVASDASHIEGQLSANGQVWLINPAGVIFGQGSRVDVGGLVASTLDTGNADFMAGKADFRGSGQGTILNRGTLHAAEGGTIALLGGQVINEGVISATLGNVVLASGSRVTLDQGADGKLRIAVDPGTYDALVANRQLIQADGGQILLTAAAAGQLRSAVVSNSGTLEARTLQNRQGRILLLSDLTHGQTDVGGILDASAEQGDGGSIETSGAKVSIDPEAKISTHAKNGRTGTWLVDPQDFTIAASGGDITGLALGTQLDSTNVTLQSSSGGTAGSGDLNVNDAVAWSADTTLTLQADRNININQSITATGNTAGLTLTPTGSYSLNNGAKVTLSGATPSLTIQGTSYTVINDVNALQAMNNNLAGNYALGSDIDASATAGWNGGAGFVPVGAEQTILSTTIHSFGPGVVTIIGTTNALTTTTYADNSFRGVFDGLNHTITGLKINRPVSNNIGLFGYVTSAQIANVGLVNANITGSNYVGGLIGSGNNNVKISSSVWIDQWGGARYYNNSTTVPASTINNSYSSGWITGASSIGGLVGSNIGAINNSYYTGGAVNGISSVGGLVGTNAGTVSNSYYDVDRVTISGSQVIQKYGLYDSQFQNWLSHGLTLDIANFGNSLTYDAASGYYLINGVQGMKDLIGFANVAGYRFRLAGNVDLASLPGYYVPTFSAAEFDGAGHVVSNLLVNSPETSGLGLIGQLNGGTVRNLGVQNVALTGGASVGGLIGFNNGGIVEISYSSGTVAGIAGSQSIGGLVGSNGGKIRNSYSTASVMLGNSYSTGLVTSGNTSWWQSGLVGINATYIRRTVGASAGLGGPATFIPSTVSLSYWSDGTSNQVYGDSPYSSSTRVGLTTAQMQTQSSFPVWDFTNIWRIYEGQSYPVLRAFQTTLTVTANDATKTYDGQAYSGGNGVSYPASSALLSGTLTYSGDSQGAVNTGSYTMTPGGLSLNRTTQQDYQNWADLAYASGTLTVNPKPLVVSNATAQDKVYDGTTTATFAGGTLNGVIAGDAVDLSLANGRFDNKNVGKNKTVSYDASLTGAGIGNYVLTSTSGTTTADITPKSLSIATATAQNKVYDGTTTATFAGGTLNGVIAGDAVDLSLANGSFDNKNVGTGKTVSYDASLAGAGAGNYALASTNGTTTADITPKSLTVTGTMAQDKVYDGTTTATFAGGTLDGVIAGDAVTLAENGSFDTKNVGTGKTVSYDASLAGAGAGNYLLANTSGTTTADITPKSLTVTGTTAKDKFYDGTTTATLMGGALNGVIAGDAVTLAQSGNFDNKNIGTSKTVVFSNGILGGDAGNYALTSLTGTTTANILGPLGGGDLVRIERQGHDLDAPDEWDGFGEHGAGGRDTPPAITGDEGRNLWFGRFGNLLRITDNYIRLPGDDRE